MESVLELNWRKTAVGPDLLGAWVADLDDGGDLVVLQRGPRQFGAAVRDLQGRVEASQEGFRSLCAAQKWAEDQIAEGDGDDRRAA